MKSMHSKLTTLLFLMITIFATSCGDDYGDVPECIEDQIKTFKKNVCDERATVGKYLFQEKEVYLFDQGYCIADGASDVLSSDCLLLGILGGFAGFNEINGVSFYENATLISIVWKN